MVSKLRVVGITTLALTIFFNGIPGFSKIESLIKRGHNQPHIASTNVASAAERKLEEAVKVEINKKRYSIEEYGAGKFLVYDDAGQFVEDEDIAQKAIYSKLVHDEEIVPYFGKPLDLHTLNFTRGELAQYAKNAVALLLVGNYNLIKNAVIGGALFGPKGALYGALFGLTNKGIIDLGKTTINNPGRIAREIGIETRKEGKRAWLRNVSLVKKLKRRGVLTYKEADQFLYDEFQWMTLTDSSNHLTSDVAMERYDTDPARHLANTTLSLMGGEAIDSYPKEDLIKEVSNILIQNLSQYEPYKRFIELNKRGTTAYIKRKIELDEKAYDLIEKDLLALIMPSFNEYKKSHSVSLHLLSREEPIGQKKLYKGNPIYILRTPIVTEKNIIEVLDIGTSPKNKKIIFVKLDSRGTKSLEEVTKQNIGSEVVWQIDGEPKYTAPIREKIDSGKLIIYGLPINKWLKATTHETANIEGVKSYKVYKAGFEGIDVDREIREFSEVYDRLKVLYPVSSLVLSHDKKRAAFESSVFFHGHEDKNKFKGPDCEVYTANVDGTNLKRISHNDLFDFCIGWSPYDTKLAYFSRKEEGPLIMSITDLINNTTKEITLRHPELNKIRIMITSPVFSPNEKKIAFNANEIIGSSDKVKGLVYVLDLDREVLRKVLEPDYRLLFVHRPIAWSSDGKKLILAESHKDKKYHEIPIRTSSEEIEHLENLVKSFERGIHEVDRRAIFERMYHRNKNGKVRWEDLVKEGKAQSYGNGIIMSFSPTDMDKRYHSKIKGVYIGPVGGPFPRITIKNAAQVYVDIFKTDKNKKTEEFIVSSYYIFAKYMDKWRIVGKPLHPSSYFRGEFAPNRNEYKRISNFLNNFLNALDENNQKELLKSMSPFYSELVEILRFNFDSFAKELGPYKPFNKKTHIEGIKHTPETNKYHVFVGRISKDEKIGKMYKVRSRVDLEYVEGKFAITKLKRGFLK